MYDDRFGFAGGDDDQAERFDSSGWRYPDDRNTVDSVNSEALELWLYENHDLWKMGLRLATMARQYKHEYRHVPYNKIGWFSPN